MNGKDEDGNRVQLKFGVASKLTRPLASVWEIVEGDNEVVFKKGHGSIRNYQGKKTPLRCEGKLWFLDVWVEVPKAIATSPFARPA